MTPPGKVLLVGSGLVVAGELQEHLRRAGVEVAHAGAGESALNRIAAEPFDLVLTEWRLPDLADGALVRRLRSRRPELPILVAGPSLPAARRREVERAGAQDYIELPLEAPRLAARVSAALARRNGDAERPSLVGRSAAIQRVLATVAQVAPTKVTVLITGESGTGKELVARAVHQESPRRDRPFVAVNCGAIPPGVLESELFGHERGAFTGAVAERKGRFELADGGTLFLDEVGELPPPVQVQLLRVLEEETFMRVGGAREVRVDTRIVAATNRDLAAGVRDGSFRQDLYFRLNVVSLHLPPLRERREDIPPLVEHFLRAAASRHDREPPRIAPDAMREIEGRPWPGNVRELRNVVESLVVLKAGETIVAEDLPPPPAGEGVAAGGTNLPLRVGGTRDEAERELLLRSLIALGSEVAELRRLLERLARGEAPEPGNAGAREGEWTDAAEPRSLEEMEREAIREALARTRGNRREAAARLGIGLRTLYRRIKSYGLE